jgi:hypothetical protein
VSDNETISAAKSETVCDVTVLGGGLAGKAAALHLAKAGLEVICIDPAESVHCCSLFPQQSRGVADAMGEQSCDHRDSECSVKAPINFPPSGTGEANLSGGSGFRKHPGSLCWQPIGRLTDVGASISPAISIAAVIGVHGFFQSVRDIN